MEHEATDAFNDGFVQMMYESWLSNPASVSDEWQQMFAGGAPNGGSTSAPPPAATATAGTAATAAQAPPAKGGNGNGATATPPAAPTPAPAGKAAPAAAKAELPEGAVLLKGPAAGLVRNMNESLTVPVATTLRTLAMSTLDARRRELNAALANVEGGRKVSFTHIVAWALIRAWREFPVMGHTFELVNNKPYRVAHEHVNFGLAVDVEKPDGSRGLMVPVVKAADTLGARGFMDRYDELVKVTRAGKLALDDMMGTTLTLTNPGGLGTEASVPRLMAHQATIIATGSIAFPVEFRHLSKERIAELGVSKVMTITSTYDHRVIQGAESGAFLRMVDEQLQGGHGFYEEVFTELGAGTPTDVVVTPAPVAAAAAAPAPTTAAASISTAATSVAEQPVIAGFQHPGPVLVTATDDQLASVASAMSLVKAHR
ncbi:MAG: 2-oxo acid dehydrogenase subunit E2, partial [Thermoleophilia bacterium]|nr:2-oxo acid dehydrogenase subunit E2 [Thermoleophilia bacterium]